MFIGGHFFIGVGLFFNSFFVRRNNSNLALLFHLVALISFQASNGAGFWVYAGEVANEQALGLCVLMMLGSQLVVSLVTPSLIL